MPDKVRAGVFPKALREYHENFGEAPGIRRQYTNKKSGNVWTPAGWTRGKPEKAGTRQKLVEKSYLDYNTGVTYKTKLMGSDGKLHDRRLSYSYDNMYSFLPEGDEEVVAYAEWMLDQNRPDHRQVLTREGCGHIAKLEYVGGNGNQEVSVLRVTFQDGTVCLYFGVPVSSVVPLLHFAETKQTYTTTDSRGRAVTRHMLGKTFWDLVRIRGRHYGAHYKWEYAKHGGSIGKHRKMRTMSLSASDAYSLLGAVSNPRIEAIMRAAGAMDDRGMPRPGVTIQVPVDVSDEEFARWAAEYVGEKKENQLLDMSSKSFDNVTANLYGTGDDDEEGGNHGISIDSGGIYSLRGEKVRELNETLDKNISNKAAIAEILRLQKADEAGDKGNPYSDTAARSTFSKAGESLGQWYDVNFPARAETHNTRRAWSKRELTDFANKIEDQTQRDMYRNLISRGNYQQALAQLKLWERPVDYYDSTSGRTHVYTNVKYAGEEDVIDYSKK